MAELDLTPAEELRRWRAWRRAQRHPNEEPRSLPWGFNGYGSDYRGEGWDYNRTPFEEYGRRHRRRGGNPEWPNAGS